MDQATNINQALAQWQAQNKNQAGFDDYALETKSVARQGIDALTDHLSLAIDEESCDAEFAIALLDLLSPSEPSQAQSASAEGAKPSQATPLAQALLDAGITQLEKQIAGKLYKFPTASLADATLIKCITYGIRFANDKVNTAMQGRSNTDKLAYCEGPDGYIAKLYAGTFAKPGKIKLTPLDTEIHAILAQACGKANIYPTDKATTKALSLSTFNVTLAILRNQATQGNIQLTAEELIMYADSYLAQVTQQAQDNLSKTSREITFELAPKAQEQNPSQA